MDLSIVLSRYNFADAEKLLSHRIRVVHNGIPDPCPDFDDIPPAPPAGGVSRRAKESLPGMFPPRR